jgi:hypothetical protein
MQPKFHSGLATLIVGVSMMLGCADQQYRDPNAKNYPADQLGVLDHPDPVHSHIVITYVDGKYRGVGIFDKYYLTPGRHTIRASGGTLGTPPTFNTNGTSLLTGGYYDLEFVVEPGKEYVIGIEFYKAEMRWFSYIKDKSTGAIVSTLKVGR